MAKTKPYIPPHYVDKDAYVADLERELAGYRRRVQELKATGTPDDEGSMVDATSGQEAVLSLLKSLGHGEPEPKKAAK